MMIKLCSCNQRHFWICRFTWNGKK